MSERPRIDWDEVKARLQASQSGAQQAERLEAVYQRRARELAARTAPLTAGAASSDTRAFLAFALGGERYALPLADLAGVLSLASWAPVPGAPPQLLGVFAHRGRICPLLDLAALLGLPAAPDLEGSAYVLLLRRAGHEVGLKVGPIEAIRRLAADAIARADVGQTPIAPFLEGLADDGSRLLSAAALLAHPVFTETPRP